jgi:hypothetical protein
MATPSLPKNMANNPSKLPRIARQRLKRADLQRPGLSESFQPWHRHQHGRAQRAGAISDQTAAGDLATIPVLVILHVVVSHHDLLADGFTRHCLREISRFDCLG